MSKYVPPTLLLEQAITGASIWVQMADGPRHVVVTFTGHGVISAGTIVIEETDDPTSNGDRFTPSEVWPQPAIDLTGGVKKCIHLLPAAYLWLRVRITADITGGSVSATISGCY